MPTRSQVFDRKQRPDHFAEAFTSFCACVLSSVSTTGSAVVDITHQIARCGQGVSTPSVSPAPTASPSPSPSPGSNFISTVRQQYVVPCTAFVMQSAR